MLATTPPFLQYSGADGLPLNDGSIFLGVANQNPETTPVTIFWDAAGTQPAAQPIRTINGYPARNGTPASVYASGDYSITVRDVNGVMMYTAPQASVLNSGTQLLTDLAASSGSSLVGTIASGTGAVARTVQAKERDTVSVRDYISTAIDGVTSNQSGIAAAVAAANLAGAELEWPAGTYVSDATIPNFHDVKHRGSGILKRGTDTFVISCKTGTNTLYVSATGLDSNDGLSAAQPRLAVQSTGNLLYNWPYGNVTWKVELAAGTFNEACTFLKPFPSPNRVTFKGPTVAVGTTPTAIMDGTASGGSGIFFQGLIRAQVESIFFKNYSTADLGTGVIIDTSGDLYTKNVWTINCARGIFATSSSRLRLEGGIIDGNNVAGSIGVSIFSLSTYTVGFNGSAKSVLGDTGPAILRCAQAAVFVQEGSMGHVDYTYIDTAGVGIDILEKSRCHLLESRVGTCTTGVRARGNSSIFTPSVNNNVFTGNTDDLSLGSDSISVDRDQSMRDARYALRETAAFSTQSTSPVTAITHTFPAGELALRGAGFSLDLFGAVVGTAGTKNITVTLGGTTLLNRTIAAASTSYRIKIDFNVRNKSGASGQAYTALVLENGASPVITSSIAVAEDMTIANALTITHSVANAADINRIQGASITVIH